MSVGGGGGTLLVVDDLLLRPSVFHSPFFFSLLTFVLSFLSFPLVFCFDFIPTYSTGIRFTTKLK